MEVVGSIASEFAKDLYSQIKHQAQYLFCFNNIVEDFKNEKWELILTQERVQNRAKDAKNNTKRIEHVVHKWLEDTESLIEEADKLEKETEIKRKCFLVWCPNCIWQYRLGRKVVKKTRELIELNANRQFENFSRLTSLPGMEYHASDDFVYFESRKAVYEQLMESLTKGERFRVGLYGMGGSGKTNLVTEVGKQAEKSKLFDKVVFVVVSSTPDIRTIQGNIASSLGLRFEEEQKAERAKRLWLRLTNGERILIILDDVWEVLDFKAVGIPYDNHQKGCRVLLTTRIREVCNVMDCQKAVELSLLKEDESWTLFKKHAGITKDSYNALKNVAQEITNECRGLPVAVAAVASTLKNKPIDDWKVALETLRQPKSFEDVDDNLKKFYSCLRLSYDNLQNEKAKTLFLLCSFFPEDYNIDVESLTRFGIGLGLFGKVSSYRWARSQVVAAKNKLIDSCLLLETKEAQCVKMHDLVRDVALWIANKEILVIKRSKMDPIAQTNKLIAQETTVKYLWCHEMRDFPNKLNSSKLEILLINTIEGRDKKVRDFPDKLNSSKLKTLLVNTVEGYDKQVRDGFFGEMKELRVLVLMNRYLLKNQEFPSLPQSMQFLTNLRTLRLSAWKLGELSELKKLESLETLELYSCAIDELPSEIIQLTCLKLLYLSNCKFRKNPYKVIGGCSQLEELGVFNVETSDASKWGNGKEISINFFVQDGSFPALQRYGIEMGDSSGLKAAMGDLICRGLSIRCFEAWTSNKVVKDLMQRAEILHLQKIQGGYKTFSPDIVEAIGGMNELVQLKLEFCSHIECLMDSTSTNLLSRASSTIFSLLRKLEIKDMDHLEELCRGPQTCDSFLNLEMISISGCTQLNNIFGGKLNFCRLKVMQVRGCPMLTFLFTPSAARSLVLLEKLEVHECKKLEYIITEDQIKEINEEIHIQSSTLILPNLKSLRLSECNALEFVFPISFVAGGLVQLEEMKIHSATKLKFIFGQNQGQGERMHINLQKMILPSLTSTSLRMSGCPNFISICEVSVELYPVASTELQAWQSKKAKWPLIPLHTAQCLSRQSLDLFNIKFMQLDYCSNLTSLFTVSIAQRILLERLEISGCQRLEFIITEMEDDDTRENHGSIFPLLRTLIVINCRRLKSIFPATFSKSFERLHRIEICQAPELKYVVGQYLQEDELSYKNQNEIHIDFPALNFLNLESLPKIIGFCPENAHLRWSSLAKVIVRNCPRLTIPCTNYFPGFLDATQVDPTTPKESSVPVTHKSHSRVEHQTLQSAGTSPCDIVLINCNIEGIFQLEELPINAPPLTSPLIAMELSNLPELSYICKGPMQVLSLQCLKYLTVNGCNNLRSIFSASIFRSLPQLRSLITTNCEQLEQIIEDNEEDQILLNNVSQLVCFPNLVALIVQHCNNLLRLFSFSSTHELRKLNLNKDKASELKKFFFFEEIEIDAEEGKQIFELQAKLPSIPEPREGFMWQTKKACVVYVHDCPKLNLTATTTSADRENEVEENSLELESLQNVKPNSNRRSKEIINENLALEFTSNLPKAPEDSNSEGIQATSEREFPCAQAINPNQILSDTETKRIQESQTQKSITPMDEEKLLPVDSSMLTELIGLITEFLSNEQGEHKEKKVTAETPKQVDMPLNQANDAMELADDSSSKASGLQNWQSIDSIEVLSRTCQSPTSTEESSFNVDIPTSVQVPPLDPLICASTEDLVDFRGLFKIDARRASLLNEAFAKYPHLWEWHKRFRPKYCKWGYKSLADMLVFLDSKTPKAMNESRQVEFRKLRAELESFGFEEGWLASINGRVMEMQVDYEKLKELAELESQEIALLDELNHLRSKLGRIRDDLSKYDPAFHF